MKTLKLRDDESEALMRSDGGQGGFQDHFQKLRQQFEPATKTIKIDDDDERKIRERAADPTKGGWQGRYHKVFGRSLG